MDIGTAKPTAAEQAEVPHHRLDLVDPSRGRHRRRLPARLRRRHGRDRRRGHRALLVGGTGLYLRAVVDDLDPPGACPGIRAELEAEPDTTELYGRLRELDPVGRRPDGADATAAASCGPSRSRSAAAGRSRLRPRARPPTRRRRSSSSACAGPATTSTRRIERRFARPAGRRLPRRGPLAWRPGPAACRAPPPRPSATASCSPTSPAGTSFDEAVDAAIARTRRFAAARSGGSAAIPGSTGSTSTGDPPCRRADRPRSLSTACVCSLTKHHGLGNDFLVAARRPASSPDEPLAVLARRLCDRRRGIGADGLHPRRHRRRSSGADLDA